MTPHRSVALVPNPPSSSADASWWSDPLGQNRLVSRDRRLGAAASPWVRSFACDDLRPLIVCRGPIRKEALDVFREMGMTYVGMLVSEKDSIVYPNALAPELREQDPRRVHRVRDYSGATREERVARTREIIAIAKEHGYDSIFAGYGFMSEDEEFVRAIQEAGLIFIGPSSNVQRQAGRKDEAKRTALKESVSVTPGVSNLATRALRKKYPDKARLFQAAREHGLELDERLEADENIEAFAEGILLAAYRKGVDLYTVDDLSREAEEAVHRMFLEYPESRIRLKWVGGGGGKGQRLVDGPRRGPVEVTAEAAAAKVPEKVREILAEVKALGPGDNKNILIELNIEETRHQEIQMLGNGEWCVALGGRDCSFQMHEQKLLEISITEEALAAEIEASKRRGQEPRARALEEDLKTLLRMEAEAERFGRAVGLDSASTFECIVERDRHYFMEVNTRIQVEHRVTELVYLLRFENPEDSLDAFAVESLVEAMALIARHGKRLPRPKRVRREGAAAEARLNATDRALQPAAGGVIHSWSPPIPGEIRDDQGISVPNPDTGQFIRYRLAGAYDSNIALLVAVGPDRRASFARLQEILRLTKMRGEDLVTNLEFHYGLVSWLLARDVFARGTTRFVVPYLTAVGLLKREADDLDLDLAYKLLEKWYETELSRGPDAEALIRANCEVLTRKETLVLRPIRWLLSDPHVLSAWLSTNLARTRIEDGRVVFLENPLVVLADTYRLLNMDDGLVDDVNRAENVRPAARAIWDHDRELLARALGFYSRLGARLGRGAIDWLELDGLLAKAEPPRGFTPEKWHGVRAAHAGFQRGLEVLGLPVAIAARAGWYDLTLDRDLRVVIPSRLQDPELAEEMKRVLAPPPATQSDQIVSAMGGTCFLREAPNLPALVVEGQHFKRGEPLYIVEVMKMFNKVLAPFDGTVKRVVIADGTTVRKGQLLFEVVPDEPIRATDAAARVAERRSCTSRFLEAVLPRR